MCLTDKFYLTEEEVLYILSMFPTLEDEEDINLLLTKKEVEEILSGAIIYSPYYRDEIHGY